MPEFFRQPIFMPLLVIVLLLLPMRLMNRQLKVTAFFIWFIGGLVLVVRGAFFLWVASVAAKASLALIAFTIVLAVVIGLAKGRFILSKTSARNIERLDSLTEAKRPIHVYSVRSWIVIGIMVLISASLTYFGVDNLIRGGVCFAIGLGLIVSSLAYLKSITASSTPELKA